MELISHDDEKILLFWFIYIITSEFNQFEHAYYTHKLI